MKTQVDNFKAIGLSRSRQPSAGGAHLNTAANLQLTESMDKGMPSAEEQAVLQVDLFSMQRYTWPAQEVQEKVLEYRF